MKKIHIPKESLEVLINERLSINQIATRLNQSYATVKKRLKEHGLKTNPVLTHSPEQRARLSILAKKRLKERPETLHVLNKSRQKSAPCEHVKSWLRTQNIPFVEEYQPLLHKDRFFSMDIAFPDKKIGIEVNGNQHYAPDGQLAPYYQERHDLIEAEGWVLYELHYSTCYRIDAISKLIPTILGSPDRVVFDYGTYIKPIKKPRVSDLDPNWRHRPKPLLRRDWPTDDALSKLVWKKPLRRIAQSLGCSDNGLIKHCRRANIQWPPAGYWRRRECGYTHEESLVSHKRPTSKPARRITPEVIKIVKQARTDGVSWRDVANLVGFSRGALIKAFNRLLNDDVKMRD